MASPIIRPDLGAKPEMKWVSKDRFVVDMTYQRVIDTRAGRKVVKEILEKFKWWGFQPPTVVPKGDKYIVVDGQHRVEAARQHPYVDEIPVYIVNDLQKVTDQAATFVSINRNRVAINSMALFHAQVVAGNKDALLIQDICEEAEITIPKYPKPGELLGPRETLSLGALKQNLHNQAELLASLMIITDAYPDTNGMLCSAYIKAVCHFYKTHGIKNINRDTLMEALLENDPFELRAKGHKLPMDVRGAAATMSQVLLQEYNKRLPAAKRLGGKK